MKERKKERQKRRITDNFITFKGFLERIERELLCYVTGREFKEFGI